MYGMSSDPYNWKERISFINACLPKPKGKAKELDPDLPPPPPSRLKFSYP
jgi:hypothetical protein